jgi:hypothetical protein
LILLVKYHSKTITVFGNTVCSSVNCRPFQSENISDEKMLVSPFFNENLFKTCLIRLSQFEEEIYRTWNPDGHSHFRKPQAIALQFHCDLNLIYKAVFLNIFLYAESSVGEHLR